MPLMRPNHGVMINRFELAVIQMVSEKEVQHSATTGEPWSRMAESEPVGGVEELTHHKTK